MLGCSCTARSRASRVEESGMEKDTIKGHGLVTGAEESHAAVRTEGMATPAPILALHYHPTPSLPQGVHKGSCGRNYLEYRLTSDLAKVTCKGCRRSREYRKAELEAVRREFNDGVSRAGICTGMTVRHIESGTLGVVVGTDGSIRVGY